MPLLDSGSACFMHAHPTELKAMKRTSGRAVFIWVGLALLASSVGCKKRGSGSCPYLFLWDEGSWVYAGDLSGSPLSTGLSFFKSEHYGVNVYSLGDWARSEAVR